MDPLGVTYTVGRWPRPDHLAAPQSITLSDSFLVAPMYVGRTNLKHRAAEVTLVQAVVTGPLLDPSNWDELDAAFEGGARR
jgi:hypothetical protein